MSLTSLGLPAFTKLVGTTHLLDLAFSSWIPTQLAKSRSYHGVSRISQSTLIPSSLPREMLEKNPKCMSWRNMK